MLAVNALYTHSGAFGDSSQFRMHKFIFGVSLIISVRYCVKKKKSLQRW